MTKKKWTSVLLAVLSCAICMIGLVACGKDDSHTHSYGEWTEVKAATCVDEGMRSRRCKCGDEQKEAIPKIDHTYGPNNECSICGHVLQFTVGLEYERVEDKSSISYQVTGIGTATDRDIVIPAYHEGGPVVKIGDSAFKYCSSLTSVTIPSGVVSIGDSAFENCSLLARVNIPNSVKRIGDSAFGYCVSLTGVTIPGGVNSIGERAFYSCLLLTRITVASDNTKYYSEENCIIETSGKTLILGCNNSIIPDGVKSIGDEAFYFCAGLTSVTIPNSVTSIGDWAFAACGLTSVTIPSSVTDISGDAFSGCPKLTEIKVAEGNPKYHSAGNCIIETASKTLIAGCNKSIIPTDGSVTSIGEYAFYGYNELTSVTIPDGVTSIGEYAFSCCTGLTSVTVPGSVTSIDDYAFDGCVGLIEINFKGSRAQWEEIEKGDGWNSVTKYTVHCTDGDIDTFTARTAF